jgi:cholesterol oxidase
MDPARGSEAAPVAADGGDRHDAQMAAISVPLPPGTPLECDVLVVGSGYGGGVAAARLARAGLHVCVLERGREYLPGDFPDGLDDALSTLRDGVVEVVRGDVAVVVGRGLGGGSLVNAGVALRPDRETFDDRWPQAMRGGAALANGFAAAEAMLQPREWEADRPKYLALADAAASLDGACSKVPLTIARTSGPNHVGVFQSACVGCGDCCSGCNFGAKTTTLATYLHDAVAHGATVYTEAEVVSVGRAESGARRQWSASVRALTDGEVFGGSVQPVLADIVVLAAGSLGSTAVLLRSRASRGLVLSPMLGRGFSANGDFLAFGWNAGREIRGIGTGSAVTPAAGQPGPTITGMIELALGREPRERALVQDGVVPSMLGWPVTHLLGLEYGVEWLEQAPTGVRDERWPSERPWSWSQRIQTLLRVGHDSGAGQIEIDAAGQPRVDWPDVGKETTWIDARNSLQQITEAAGAAYLAGPLPGLLGDAVTVHPLGGCRMADAGEHGVVDDRGRVFTGKGTAVHEGLYVMDGAVVPASLGANPLLTITAIAERNVALLVDDLGRAARPTQSMPAQEHRRAGLRFSERMRGWCSPLVEHDHLVAESAGRPTSPVTLQLHVVVDDLAALLEDTGRTNHVTGFVELPALSATPFSATGEFRLFVEDRAAVDLHRMTYDLDLVGSHGSEHYHLSGYKLLHDDGVFDVVQDTTTLRVDVTSVADGRAVLRGVARIELADIAALLRTLEVTGVEDRTERLRLVAAFGQRFAGRLFRTYGGVFVTSYDFARAPRATGEKRCLRLPVAREHWVPTADGVEILLTRYRAEGPPVLLAPGFGVSTLSFDAHTVDENLPEFLHARGYDVWLLDYRASPRLPSSKRPFTIDDVARYDWPAAVRTVRAVARTDSVHVVGHCVGSMSLLMAMCLGMPGVRSAVCSQLTLHARTNWLNRAKALLSVAGWFRRIGVNVLDTWAQPVLSDYIVDRLLRLYPMPAEERCRSAVCRRIFAIYGPSYLHANLNDATHALIPSMFGREHVHAFGQLARIVEAGRVIDASGGDSYMPHIGRLAIPMLFIAGTENEEFLPETSRLTFELLRSMNPSELYRRVVFENYGHMDCFVGEHAARDIFPTLVEHLDAH